MAIIIRPESCHFNKLATEKGRGCVVRKTHSRDITLTVFKLEFCRQLRKKTGKKNQLKATG
jgi:hypothetical protein